MSRLEILQQRMREEEARKSARAEKKPPKVAKPKIERPTPITQEPATPPFPLTDVAASLTKDEMTPKNITMLYSFAILDELIRCGGTLSTLSDGEMADTAYITAQAYEEKPNLPRVISTALRVVDSIEVRLGASEGEAIRRLRTLEKTLIAQKMKLEPVANVVDGDE